MLDGTNVVVLTGGVTRDPEIFKDTVLKFSLAIDYAGSNAGKSDTGYFDVTYFLNSDNQRNADWVKGQVQNGNMKKGSPLHVVGRLMHDRWTDDSGNRSKVYVVAESIAYMKRFGQDATGDTPVAATGEAPSIPEF